MVGPLLTAIVGTLIFGIVVARITRKAQERYADNQSREERLRADNQLQEERLRSENRLRLQLIDQMTEAASSLYIATQNFWRKKDVEKVAPDELAKHREELDQQYRASRVMGEVIERRLEAYFSVDEPKTRSEPQKLWHATMDLLTIRYFSQIGLATDKLLLDNAGEEHTGLSVDELKHPAKVLDTYREKLSTSTQAVLQKPIRPLIG